MQLPKGKTWLEVDMSVYGIQRYGANTTFLAGADQDPVEALNLATSAPAHVTDLGPDWLPDNTLNTHYRATVRVLDVAKAAGVKGAGLKALQADMAPTRRRSTCGCRRRGGSPACRCRAR